MQLLLAPVKICSHGVGCSPWKQLLILPVLPLPCGRFWSHCVAVGMWGWHEPGYTEKPWI